MTPIEVLCSMPPGMIGFAAGEQGRYTDFTVSMVALWKPSGTVLKRSTGLGPAVPFNEIGRAFISDPKLEWLFLTNDDNLCPPDTIPRLWDHHVPVITGLYFGRLEPFEPILFDEVLTPRDVDPSLGIRVTSDRWVSRKFMRKGEYGTIPIVACGDGCLLIRREVMEAIPQPWWEYGEVVTDACDHDMVFSRKVREAGFGLYCDTDLWVDHLTNIAIRPHRDSKGNWTVQLVQGLGRTLSVPAPTHRKG